MLLLYKTNIQVKKKLQGKLKQEEENIARLPRDTQDV